MDELEAILETGGAAAVEFAASALAERGGKVGHCANCGSPIIGPYCAICGQAIDTHRRSLGGLLHDFFKDVASFDSRILRTACALLFEPGELPLAFRQGRTRRYVPPVRLYLFVSLIFFLTLGATGIALVQLVPKSIPEKIVVEKDQVYALIHKNGETSKIKVPAALNDGRQHYAISTNGVVFFAREGSLHSEVTPAALKDLEQRKLAEGMHPTDRKMAWIGRGVKKTLEELAKDPAALNGYLTTWIPRVLFLLLPVFALLLAAFYRRQRRQYFFVDHLVFSLGQHSFGFALLLVAAGLAQFLPGELVFWLIVVTLGVYLLLAMKRFYGQNWFWTATKFVGVAGIYTVFFVFPAILGIFAASVFNG
jgi:hypothetical protein